MGLIRIFFQFLSPSPFFLFYLSLSYSSSMCFNPCSKLIFSLADLLGCNLEHRSSRTKVKYFFSFNPPFSFHSIFLICIATSPPLTPYYERVRPCLLYVFFIKLLRNIIAKLSIANVFSLAEAVAPGRRLMHRRPCSSVRLPLFSTIFNYLTSNCARSTSFCRSMCPLNQ